MTQTPPTSPPSPTPLPSRAARLRALARRVFTVGVLAHGLFWSWNLIFLAVVYAGLFPHHLVDILLEVLDGTVPLNLAFSAFLLCTIPLVCTVVGALYFRRQPRKLLRLFYGLEGPLMFAALVRLFMFRELPPAMVFLVVALALCLVSYGVELVRGEAPAGRITAWALHLGASLSLLGCLYAVSVLSFYAPPVAWALAREFFAFGWVRELWSGLRHQHGMGLVMLPLSLVLFAYTASLFAALPVAMLALYVGLYRRTLRALSAHAGALRPLVATCLVIAATTALFVRLNHQPQREVLNRLAQPPQSDAERLALRTDAEAIKKGLLAAYLAPHRYLSATGSNDHIETIYRTVLHVPTHAAQRLQLAYNALAAPILYDGASTHADRSAAEQHYEAFFDAPIQKGERAAILRATQATFSREQREAGLLNVGERKVWLARQEVRVTESAADGAVAEVDLHEVYQNQTVEQQEIFYYFTLPESAVVTGLWLSDSDDRDKGFRFVVAPRGAAQKVYRAEVRRRSDPALLEQLGPRQYRLRAFPIPPRPSLRHERGYTPAPLFHLFLSYKVLRAPGQREWPLPALVERRNVYATASTRRLVNGAAPRELGEDWLPPSVAAQGPAPSLPPRALELLPGVRVKTVPLDAEKLPLPSGQRFALVLDRSASMERHAAAVRELFASVGREAGARNQLDLYLTASAARGEAPQRLDGMQGFDPARTVYFGGQRTSELLRQFGALRGTTQYAAVILISDDGSLDLARDNEPIHDFAAPVYVVHVGGVLAPGYDDATLASIQKRGGAVTTDQRDVFRHLAARAMLGPGFISLDAGYAFLLERDVPPAETTAPAATATDGATATAAPEAQVTPLLDPLAAIAARQLIVAALRDLDLASVQGLDALHRLARAYGIVTPYSSMLVLVDERQREALRKAEQDKDRFRREVESGSEQVSTPSDLMVTGTPEPGEWLLLGLVVLAVAALSLQQRRQRALRGQPA
ncbi:MAG: TIGR02921 family PEP-CTERM protein [Polyangia bacterium]